jgi:hypothetical protein
VGHQCADFSTNSAKKQADCSGGDAELTKRSKQELIRLVEKAVCAVGGFSDRGVWFCVDELEVFGQPIERIRVWATLHFLPNGSPFDSDDADLWVRPLKDDVSEFLRREMKLVQIVTIEWKALIASVYPGVKFEGNGGHRV